jgi:hypothetical protein
MTSLGLHVTGLLLASLVLFIVAATNPPVDPATISLAIVVYLVWLVAFIPTFNANHRHHENRLAIFWLTLKIRSRLTSVGSALRSLIFRAN